MTAGVTYTVDLPTRISNLEAAVFGGASPQSIGVPVPSGGFLEVESASGAIGITTGLSILAGSGILAMTLAVPSPQDNGKILRIISTTANAHVITTPTNGLEGAYSTVTLGGNINDFVELQAYNSGWVVTQSKNATLAV